MADAIVSREVIARQAEAAATWAAANPKKPAPPNPYCEHLQPEHHLEWTASFTRSHQQLTVPDAEASA